MSGRVITITLTAREAALLLANEWNDHPSWSDIAHKIRAAQRDRSASGDDHAIELPADPEDEDHGDGCDCPECFRRVNGHAPEAQQ